MCQRVICLQSIYQHTSLAKLPCMYQTVSLQETLCLFCLLIPELDCVFSRHLLRKLHPSGFSKITLPAGSRHANCICTSCAVQCKCLALLTAMLRGLSLRSIRCNPAQTMQTKGLSGQASMSLWMCSWSWKALGTSQFLWQEHPLMRERVLYLTRKLHLPVAIVLLYSIAQSLQ